MISVRRIEVIPQLFFFFLFFQKKPAWSALMPF